ncbi:unannotated protein [freshwater metagenome]|uniref:Unannotated protein n=1 Tax=freshwater metagenome TaxID=449393 RepID=A0A6J7BNS6_9ZZZZ
MHVEQRVARRAALARDHVVDHHCDRVRKLVVNTLERRLANELGHHDPLRLVSELAVGVEAWPGG